MSPNTLGARLGRHTSSAPTHDLRVTCEPKFAAPVRRYRHTTARTPWDALPRAVRSLIIDLLGGYPCIKPVVTDTGFTRSFAATVHPEGRNSAFVRAVPESNGHAFRQICREARVLRWLPAGSPAPKLWHATSALDNGQRWHIAITEPINAHRLGIDPDSNDIDVVHEALISMNDLIPTLPATLQPHKVTDVASSHPGETPWFYRLAARDVEVPHGMPNWLPGRSRELAHLSRIAHSTVTGHSTCHAGIRPDRITFDEAGTVRFTGWNTAAIGPAWCDWVTALLWSGNSRADADARLHGSPLTHDVPSEHIDAFLATLAADNLRRLSKEAATGYTSSTTMLYRDAAVTALQWLAHRRLWPEGNVVQL